MKDGFCELSRDEMVLISGGKAPLKNTLCIIGGSILTANSLLIGAIGTPAMGAMALGTGLKLLGKGKLLTKGE